MTTLKLPNSYAEFKITNGTPLADTALYIFLQSQTQMYQITNQVATPTNTNPTVVTLSDLSNGDGTYSLYVDSTQALTSGRIYFSDSSSAVSLSGGNIIGPSPNAAFNFDFVELTIAEATAKTSASVNLDTSQIDQFGMPITVQVTPADTDFPNGTGIVANMSRSIVISNFNTFTSNKDFSAYASCIQTISKKPLYQRLLGPQHALDLSGALAGLTTQFDDAIYNLFNYYTNNTLYIVANGANGMEIFSGNVITDYTLPSPLTDANNNTGTKYTVFQFTGTGFYYDSDDNSLSPVTKPLAAGQTNVYNIFYPYFSTNYPSTFTNTLIPNGPPAPPVWWQAGWNTSLGNLKSSALASQMVFACNGVFGDSAYQEAAFSNITGSVLQDATVLGNIENQLVTMLNRGISPNTGSNNCNFHQRIGSVSSLNPIDTSNLTSYNSSTSVAPSSTVGASTIYTFAGVPSNNGIVQDTISGSISLNGQSQNFSLDIYGNFNISTVSGSSQNYATAGTVNMTENLITSITIDWLNAVNINDVMFSKISYQYGPVLSGNYAKVNLLNPYTQGTYPFILGNLGPNPLLNPNPAPLYQNLVKGMQMTTLANFSQPMEVYFVDTLRNTVIIQSCMQLQPFNTGILTFANFYPVNGTAPVGAWNAYSYFFHNGNFNTNIPTIDGRGYAFPFDDNAGYSSDLNVNLANSNPTATIKISLNAW